MGVGYEFGKGEVGLVRVAPVHDADEVAALRDTEDLSPLALDRFLSGSLLEGLNSAQQRGQGFATIAQRGMVFSSP
ncbi:hypothetical protein ACPCIU_15905 [Streptomyces seoulensis]|uniref:hypothetical protein n=1 Tax=Streptomyces seoulensis TaxID=73044 RepID=UPI003C2AB02A